MGGSSVWYGALSLDDFNASAKALIEKWRDIAVNDSFPDWIWKTCCKMGVPSEVEGYLALERVYHFGEGSQEKIVESNNFEDADIVGDDAWRNWPKIFKFKFKFKILVVTSPIQISSDEFRPGFSRVFRLSATRQDFTRSRALVMMFMFMISMLCTAFLTRFQCCTSRVIRLEHPHLSRPWFTLHPCGTSDWMKLLLDKTKLADMDQSLQYLPAWLSVVGQAVGLKIPLELYCNS